MKQTMTTASRTLLVLIIGTAILLPSGVAAASPPNIILIAADDMGFGYFAENQDLIDENPLSAELVRRDKGEYSEDQARQFMLTATPTLSTLSQEGVRFTNAYVPSPLCGPSRAALMTARYPQRYGIYNNVDAHMGVNTGERFLVENLQLAGYATAMIGKWHLSKDGDVAGNQDGYHPLQRGFDHYFGFNRSGTLYYDSKILYRNYEKVDAEGYLTDQFTGEAVSLIENQGDEPLFIYLAYNAVHGPLRDPAPEVYSSRFKTDNSRLNIFYSYLYALDQGVNSILEALKKTGRIDNTLIMFVSDNGSPGGKPFPLPGNSPFRGYKGQIWQGGTRVPMMAWWPGKIEGGQVSKALVTSMDLLPSALAAGGVELPDDLDGASLFPLLGGKQDSLRDQVFWAGQLAQNWGLQKGGGKLDDKGSAPPAWAVRSGPWMLRYWSHADSVELYDMRSDLPEQANMASQHPNVVKKLTADYRQWFSTLEEPQAWDRVLWQQLKAE